MDVWDISQLSRDPNQTTEDNDIGDRDQAIRRDIPPHKPGLGQVAIAVRQIISREKRRKHA
jgi:hypothetical protein